MTWNFVGVCVRLMGCLSVCLFLGKVDLGDGQFLRCGRKILKRETQEVGTQTQARSKVKNRGSTTWCKQK